MVKELCLVVEEFQQDQELQLNFIRVQLTKEKNLNLISKVVASGHKTILEHHHFNIAFNNVSIFIEQYLIEFRLASYTIKSGRYVNFSKAGFNLPNEFTDTQKSKIKSHYKEMFKLYDKFVAANIPVEDARFILPYGLKTNIYMSLNARELIHVICTMIYGRGKHYSEVYSLGMQLKSQFDERYPSLIEANAKYYTEDLSLSLTVKNEPAGKPEYVTHSAELVSFTENASEKLDDFAKFCGYDKFDFKTALKDNKLSKLLEHFNYTFKVENFSLIVLKHYTRHRMQSLSTAPIVNITNSNKFVMPESIKQNAELKTLYESAIKKNRKLYNLLVAENLNPYLMISLIREESFFNNEAVSSTGAMGLMQLMPSTAAGLGVKDPMDPVQNVDGGVRYLKSMLDSLMEIKFLLLQLIMQVQML